MEASTSKPFLRKGGGVSGRYMVIVWEACCHIILVMTCHFHFFYLNAYICIYIYVYIYVGTKIISEAN